MKKEEIFYVSKDEFLQRVKTNFENRDAFEQSRFYKKGSYKDWGNTTCRNRAVRLFNRVFSGQVPSTREVVAYFGKGARLEEPCDYFGELNCELPLNHEGLHHGFDPKLEEEISWE